jgi:integrase
MHVKTPTGRNPKGAVPIIESHGRLQLRFRFGAKRHYISLGFPDTPNNRKLAESRARQIELDILSNNFDTSLAKYKPQSALSPSDALTNNPPSAPKVSHISKKQME